VLLTSASAESWRQSVILRSNTIVSCPLPLQLLRYYETTPKANFACSKWNKRWSMADIRWRVAAHPRVMHHRLEYAFVSSRSIVSPSESDSTVQWEWHRPQILYLALGKSIHLFAVCAFQCQWPAGKPGVWKVSVLSYLLCPKWLDLDTHLYTTAYA
jgi:hypothetical protein